jgi:hypothetical protein
MLWYGICAGLSPRSRVLTDSNYLGLRIHRCLSRQESLVSYPSSDISLNELKIILRGNPKGRGFRQINSSFLRVEIAPLVTTVVAWPNRQVAGGQLSLFAPDLPKAAGSEANRLNAAIRSLKDALTILESQHAQTDVRIQSSTPQQRGKRRRSS